MSPTSRKKIDGRGKGDAWCDPGQRRKDRSKDELRTMMELVDIMPLGSLATEVTAFDRRTTRSLDLSLVQLHCPTEHLRQRYRAHGTRHRLMLVPLRLVSAKKSGFGSKLGAIVGQVPAAIVTCPPTAHAAVSNTLERDAALALGLRRNVDGDIFRV